VEVLGRQWRWRLAGGRRRLPGSLEGELAAAAQGPADRLLNQGLAGLHHGHPGGGHLHPGALVIDGDFRRRQLTEGWLMFNSGAARTVLPLNSIRSNTRTSLSALGVRYGAMTAASAGCSVSAAGTVRAVFRAKKRKMGSANASPDD
jgi:hypothetical protein